MLFLQYYYYDDYEEAEEEVEERKEQHVHVDANVIVEGGVGEPDSSDGDDDFGADEEGEEAVASCRARRKQSPHSLTLPIRKARTKNCPW